MRLSTNILGKSEFALWLIKLRKNLGLNQEALAEKASRISEEKISEAYIGFLEDKRNPADATLKKLIALAKALEVSPTELVNKALEEALNKSKTTVDAMELAPKSRRKIAYDDGTTKQKLQKKAG